MLEKINDSKDLKTLSISDLEELCQDIRDLIIKTVNNNGGHLSSNLGVVELTVALHYVFDLPNDKIIWDVGHQCYAHKILSGRKSNFETLRKEGGLSGFPKREESPYDAFNTGHSSTSISSAIGMARARNLKNETNNIICVIGDGSLNNGMAFEALDDLATSNAKVLLILNDNEMSISKTVGGLPLHLSKLRVNGGYRKLKSKTKKFLSRIPLGNGLIKILDGFKSMFSKIFMKNGILFEDLGLKYVGPIDGHNLNQLIHFLRKIEKMDTSVVFHIITQKGKGYLQAELNPEMYHGVNAKNSIKADEYSKALGEELTLIAEHNDKIIAISAAMEGATGLSLFNKRFPDRFFDVGIAEEHAVTLSAGFAVNGMKPYFAVYSTFLQRAFDQIIHDVCIQDLPVVFCIDRAGVTGNDGETHQGCFDLSYLGMMPNMTIVCPKDKMEFRQFIKFSENFNQPMAIRYPRVSKFNFEIHSEIVYGKWEKLTEKDSNCYILACGERMINLGLKICSELNVNLVNCRFIKPLDKDFLEQIRDKNIVTLEENVLIGGFGQQVTSYLIEKGYNAKVKNFALNDNFIPQGNIDTQIDGNGINFNEIREYIKKII